MSEQKEQSKVSELKGKWINAYEEVRKVQDLRRVMKIRLENAMEKALNMEFGETLERLRKEEAEAKRLLEEEEDKIRLASVKPPHPEGTVLVLWSRDRLGYGPLKQTSKMVAVEVVRADSKFKSGIKDYSRPKNGEVIGRVLKRDGTPGLLFEKLNSWETWLPIGVKPGEDKR